VLPSVGPDAGAVGRQGLAYRHNGVADVLMSLGWQLTFGVAFALLYGALHASLEYAARGRTSPVRSAERRGEREPERPGRRVDRARLDLQIRWRAAYDSGAAVVCGAEM
jgi:hypothetical protein